MIKFITMVVLGPHNKGSLVCIILVALMIIFVLSQTVASHTEMLLFGLCVSVSIDNTTNKV